MPSEANDLSVQTACYLFRRGIREMKDRAIQGFAIETALGCQGNHTIMRPGPR